MGETEALVPCARRSRARARAGTRVPAVATARACRRGHRGRSAGLRFGLCGAGHGWLRFARFERGGSAPLRGKLPAYGSGGAQGRLPRAPRSAPGVREHRPAELRELTLLGGHVPLARDGHTRLRRPACSASAMPGSVRCRGHHSGLQSRHRRPQSSAGSGARGVRGVSEEDSSRSAGRCPVHVTFRVRRALLRLFRPGLALSGTRLRCRPLRDIR